jgi:hypothetical protein
MTVSSSSASREGDIEGLLAAIPSYYVSENGSLLSVLRLFLRLSMTRTKPQPTEPICELLTLCPSYATLKLGWDLLDGRAMSDGEDY